MGNFKNITIAIMALTDKQKLGKCCGIFCSFLACLNIWFFIGMTIFQAKSNAFMKTKLENFENAGDDSSNWTTAFAITLGLNVICMFGCYGCTTMGCYKDQDEIVYYSSANRNANLFKSREINES